MFSGFYLKKFNLTLPNQFRSYVDTGKKVKVGAENLIIDEYGVSGKIIAKNVLNYPKANIGDLGASIDTVRIGLANSALTEAMVIGKITLPLCKSDDTANAINYSGMFTTGADAAGSGASAITFALWPNKDVKARFLGDGKLQIDRTSNLSLIIADSSNGDRKICLDIDLNGRLSYPTGKILDPGSSIPLDLDLSCGFEHLGMTYRSGATQTFTFDPGLWSFASPQKNVFQIQVQHQECETED